LNLLVHAGPKSTAPGTVDAATAYSVASHTRNTKITIGDPLPLAFSVRWYPSTTLPPGWSGYGGHIYTSTLLYCLLSAGASAAICIAYFRGVDLPRRLKRYTTERMNGGGRFGGAGGGGGYGLPVSNGRGGVGGSGMGWADMGTEVVEVRGKGIEGVVAYGSACKSYVDIVWHSEVCTYVNDFGNNVFRIL
jgi:hypothetical protein